MTSALDEVDLLQRLRAAPGLFERLRAESGPELARQQRLRQDFPEELVRAALTLEELRRRAAPRFSRAAEMWFDRTGLEQATTEAVARHKARRFEGRGRVWDLCCGIGSDAIALSARGEVVAVDSNSAQCLRTQWNAEVHGVASSLEVVRADVERLESDGLPDGRPADFAAEFVHIDPDRRPGGRSRSVRLEDSVPGLPFLQNFAARGRGGGIKVSPAANFPGKFPGAEIELVSLDGECKEATIWYGDLAEPDLWRATVLTQEHAPKSDDGGVNESPASSTQVRTSTLAGHPLDWVADVAPLQRYLYDPDPAVVRAGLIDRLAVGSGFLRLDAAEEYLTSDERIDTPFARPFEVLAELPWREKDVRAWFREHPVGALEIKCRHIAVAADELRRRIPHVGSESGVLVIARIEGKARAIICRRC